MFFDVVFTALSFYMGGLHVILGADFRSRNRVISPFGSCRRRLSGRVHLKTQLLYFLLLPALGWPDPRWPGLVLAKLGCPCGLGRGATKTEMFIGRPLGARIVDNLRETTDSTTTTVRTTSVAVTPTVAATPTTAMTTARTLFLAPPPFVP